MSAYFRRGFRVSAGTAENTSCDDTKPDHVAELARLMQQIFEWRIAGKIAELDGPVQKGLELAEAIHGPDHLNVAWLLGQLGHLAKAREQHEISVPAVRRALAIYEAELGLSHPDTLQSVEDLASALFELDPRDKEVELLGVRMIMAYEEERREGVEFADLMSKVAWRRYWVGHYVEAEPLLLTAHLLSKRLRGIGAPETAIIAKRLAVMYDHRGFDFDPELYYRESMAGFEEAFAEDSTEVFEARYRLAEFLVRQGKANEAGPLFEQLITTIRTQSTTLDQDIVLWTLGPICQFLRSAGRDQDAHAIEKWADTHSLILVMYRKEVRRAEQVFGSESQELASTLVTLAEESATEGRADEAEVTASRVVAILTHLHGADNPSVVKARERLSTIRNDAEVQAKARTGPTRRSPIGGERFDPNTSPWLDDRRYELIHAYLQAIAQEDDADETGAVTAVTALCAFAEIDEQWDFILELINEAPNDDHILTVIATGPLQGLISLGQEEIIAHVEQEASDSSKFRLVLTGVRQLDIADPVWLRVHAAQAEEPRPLALPSDALDPRDNH